MVRVCVIALFFLPIFASSQNRPGGKLHSYFTLYCQAEGKLAPEYTPFREFIDKLETRQATFKSEKAFIHHVFVKAHQRFFGQFQEYSTFSDLVSKGSYNCLSGTALFTLLLDYFMIDHQIIETNHHIFIIAETGEGPVLLETTDAEKGFISDPKAISRRLSVYNTVAREEIRDSDAYHFEYDKTYSDTVTQTGILGLLHYNHSVEALNRRDFKKAIAHLHHALLLHRSEKLEAYLDVVYHAVLFDRSVQPEVRNNHLEKLRALRTKKRVHPGSVSMVPLVR